MKYKTNKLKKLEAGRWSLLTDDLSRCFLCGGSRDHIHEIYEGAYRQASMRYGCCIPLCWSCHALVHSDRSVALKLKKECMTTFIKIYDESTFLSVFKINYFYR